MFWSNDVRLSILKNQLMHQNQMYLDTMDIFCGNTGLEGEMEWESKLTYQMDFHLRERDIWRPVKDGELSRYNTYLCSLQKYHYLTTIRCFFGHPQGQRKQERTFWKLGKWYQFSRSKKHGPKSTVMKAKNHMLRCWQQHYFEKGGRVYIF